MSQIVQPRVLKGFRDFLPETEIAKRNIQNTLEETFQSFGMVPIDTPVLEYTDVLLGKGSGETDKQIYRFTDHGRRDVSMRFDLTVPFARFMAANVNNLYLPFKRYHIAKVWRGENTQRGRYREFTQCDFDIVGVDSAEADFEILSIMHESFKSLGISDIHIHISHREIFNTFLEKMELLNESQEILRTVDKLAKIGEKEVLKQLEKISNTEKAQKIIEYISATGDFKEVLTKIEGFCEECDGIKRLKLLYKMMCDCNIEELFILNPSITRGLDYYTGIVYETFLDKLPAIGSVCSGGRYNNLASIYSKVDMPGVGSSIGIDRLMAALEELDVLTLKNSLTDVLITNMDNGLKGYYYFIASTLRKKEINCEVFLEQKKLKNQFNFAEKKKIPFAVICGEEEFNKGKLTLKNLNTRESFNMIDIEKVISIVKEKG